MPWGGHWAEVLNSDASTYGGSGVGNAGGFGADRVPMHQREWSLNLTLPPLAVSVFKGRRPG